MRYARGLSRHLDELRMVWRQVEAALDRVESARDTDESGRVKTEALLDAASAIERIRVTGGLSNQPLGDAIVGQLPTVGRFVDEHGVESIGPIPDPWDEAVRTGRLPGTDEIELAIADVATVPFPPMPEPIEVPNLPSQLVLAAIRLPGRRLTVEAELDGVLDTVVVPSYPAWGASIAADRNVDLTIPSLFGLGQRRDAAVAESLDGDLTTPWSGLVLVRRTQGGPDVPLTGALATGSPSGARFDAALRLRADALVADVRESVATRLGVGRHAQVAGEVAAGAGAAATAGSLDAASLEAAATVIDQEGVDGEVDDLADQLRQAAVWAGAPEPLQAVADAADALALTLAGNPVGWFTSAAVRLARQVAADALADALAALPVAGSASPLVAVPIELGPLGRELDVVVADRIAYPDGTLRLLRAIELGFARWWPLALRQLQLRARERGPLPRAMNRFLRTFVDNLVALVDGTPTTFGAGPLITVQPANTGAVALVLDAPASAAPSIGRQIEAGQIAIVTGDRPVAALVLGVAQQGEHLTARTGALRVSLVPPDLAPGSPGVVDAGVRLAAIGSGGLSADELRRGFATDPARDGLVEQAVGLASQLSLLAGETMITRSGDPIVPQPAGGPLHQTRWYGRVPAMTVSFILQGVPEPWWDRNPEPDEPPLPLLVRPGELLLLRGTVDATTHDAEAEAGEEPVVAQSVVEVDRALRIPGRMFERFDLTRAAVLAADPARLGAIGSAPLVCGPDEDLVLLTLRRTWQARPLTGPVTLRRDFAGFDLLTLATGTPMGDDLVEQVTGSPPPNLGSIDRGAELDAATGLLAEWTRYGRQ
ncbi:MAG: hypothetical protein ACK5RL_06555 [Acidimicrobiales bacterium]